MNALNLAIQTAINSSGQTKEANKAYLEFLKANFIIPIEKHSAEDAPEVLFFHENNQTYLPVFSEKSYLDAWAAAIKTEIKLLQLSAVDLLKGIGEEVIVCLDLGSAFYKEFNPGEIARMRSMVLKLFKN